MAEKIGKFMQRVMRYFGVFLGITFIFCGVSMVLPTLLDYFDKKSYMPVSAVVSHAAEKKEIDYCSKKYRIDNLVNHPRRNGRQNCEVNSRGKQYDAERDYMIYHELLTLDYKVDGKSYSRFLERIIGEDYFGMEGATEQRKLYAHGTNHEIFYDKKDPSKIVWKPMKEEGLVMQLLFSAAIFAIGFGAVLFSLRFKPKSYDWNAVANVAD